MKTILKEYTEQELKQLIKDYLNEEFIYDENEDELTDNFPLIEEGIIDSMGIMRIVSWLEDDFDIEINPEDLLLENFENVNAILNFILKRNPWQ